MIPIRKEDCIGFAKCPICKHVIGWADVQDDEYIECPNCEFDIDIEKYATNPP